MTTLALTRSTPALRPLFTATVLLGSFLLFLIQPMFGRSVLPVLGGSPSVWNTAMLFYQAVLLLGYLYAHAIRHLPLGRQLMIHLALFAAAALTLPVAMAEWLPAQGSTPPVLWLLGLLAASIGPVFFVVSAQAPLMQAWFARSNHADAADPYFLYAASNLGSFAALIAYPLLVEPALRLGDQALLWSAGFALLAVLVAACGLAIRGSTVEIAEMTAVSVTWRQRARWTLLAFVPSGLLLSTTTHLTTDIMAMPLLWVIPLAVYLLSFIAAFASAGPRLTRIAVRIAPVVLLLAGSWACLTVGASAALGFAASGIALLFVIALALHGTLALERPAAGALTDFYLWISVGGVLGGVFCALIAPLVFDWPYEHPILLVAAAALIAAPPLLPSFTGLFGDVKMRIAVIITAVTVSVAAGLQLTGSMESVAASGMNVAAGAGMFLLLGFALLAAGRPLFFACLFATLILALGGWRQIELSNRDGARERSFFGVYTVNPYAGSDVKTLMHGTTLHGVQSLDASRVRVPMTYYAPGSGVGLTMAAAPALFSDAARIGFVGLGTGTLACYARPGQDWTVYEIDPVMVGIARHSFSYLQHCRPDLRIVIGDARLTLAKAVPAGLDILAVDAFSSDAIPLHLVTREAFRVYGRALQPDGVLLVHISNRFLDLEPVVAAIANAEGWSAGISIYKVPGNQPRGQYFTSSTWIALTRTPARLAALEAATPAGNWRPVEQKPSVTAWSDDFASILPVLKRPR